MYFQVIKPSSQSSDIISLKKMVKLILENTLYSEEQMLYQCKYILLQWGLVSKGKWGLVPPKRKKEKKKYI